MTHSFDGVQQIGVGEAWQLLARTGKLVRNVRMAVFDSGFPPRWVCTPWARSSTTG